jgi:hypothetical protein
MAVEESELRTQLQEAFKASTEDPPDTPAAAAPETPAPAEPKADASGRLHGEGGRFVSVAKKEDEPAPAASPTAQPAKPDLAAPDPAKAAAPSAPEAPAAPTSAPAPPNGWSAQAKAQWHALPADVQAAIQQREQDVAKFTSKTDDERAFGREMHRVVQPYLAQIQAEGGTPAGAVQSLLNTAYVLRNGTPQQKQQALKSVAAQFNIEFPGAADAPQVPPEMQPLYQRIEQLEGSLQQRERDQQQATAAQIQSDIDTFAADPKHTHFQEVKAHMAALLKGGVAKDLQDAYDQACYARPDIRATLSAQQRAEEEQKRRAEEKARADAARAKAVSITGGPGNAAQPAPTDRSLRDELQANFRAASGAV